MPKRPIETIDNQLTIQWKIYSLILFLRKSSSLKLQNFSIALIIYSLLLSWLESKGKPNKQFLYLAVLDNRGYSLRVAFVSCFWTSRVRRVENFGRSSFTYIGGIGGIGFQIRLPRYIYIYSSEVTLVRIA